MQVYEIDCAYLPLLGRGAVMSWTASQFALVIVGGLHAIIMIGELYPWECPFIMGKVLESKGLHLSDNDAHFVSTVVHNAGIYNGIVALSLFAAAKAGTLPIQIALLAGGIIAGLFGFATLTKITIVQAILSALALAVVVWS